MSTAACGVVGRLRIFLCQFPIMDEANASTSGTNDTDFPWRMAAGVLVGLLALACWFAFDPLLVTNDATQSISVARHLARGEGVRTSIIYYGEQYSTGQVPAPQTVFPPGYPALIAVFFRSGLPVAAAAYLVVSICFAMVAVLMLLTARRMGLSLRLAVALTLVWCGCVQCWHVTRGCMSEMPFIAFTLLSLYLLPPDATSRTHARQEAEATTPNGRTGAWLIWLSGCAAATAFTMRYAGIFWFITVAGFYAVSLRERFWSNLRSALIWGSVPLLTVGVLFWRNQRLSGEWTGGNAIGGQQPTTSTLHEMYDSLSQLFGWSRSRMAEGSPAEWLLMAALLVGIVWLIGCRRTLRIDRRRMQAMADDSRLLLSYGYVVTTICLLVYLNSRTPIGLGARKLLPLLPFLLLGTGKVASALSVDSSTSQRLIKFAGGLLLAAVIFGQLQVWRSVGSPHPAMQMVAASLESPAGEQTLLQSLQSEITNETPLLSNESQRVGYLIDRPVLGLPSPEYTDIAWAEEPVHELVQKYGVRRIVLFVDALAASEFRPPFFEDLAEGNIPDWMEVESDGERLRTYRATSPQTHARE